MSKQEINKEKPRMIYLLQEAARTFSNCSDPFSWAWLRDHNVTLEECGNLSALISFAIQSYLEDMGEG